MIMIEAGACRFLVVTAQITAAAGVAAALGSIRHYRRLASGPRRLLQAHCTLCALCRVSKGLRIICAEKFRPLNLCCEFLNSRGLNEK